MFSFPKGEVEIEVECRFSLDNPGATLTGRDGNPKAMSLVPGKKFVTFTGTLPLYVDQQHDECIIEVLDSGESYGSLRVHIGKILRECYLYLTLKPSEARVRVKATGIPLPQHYAVFNIECKDLDKMDKFGKSDPYVDIYRKNHREKWVRIFRSKHIKKTLNPKWGNITIPYDYFCTEAEHLFQDPSQNDIELLIKVWDYDRFTPDDLIGQVTVKFNQLFGTEYPLLRDKKYKKKKENSGTITFKDFKIKQTKGYVDYFVKGLERIKCSFFIDFGGYSNRKKYEDDWVKAIDAIAKSFRHNGASTERIKSYKFNHHGSMSGPCSLSEDPLGRKELVEMFKADNHMKGLSRVYEAENNDGKVIAYGARFGHSIRRGAQLGSGKDYHVSVYFTDNLFAGVDRGDLALYKVNEEPLSWSAAFVCPAHEGVDGDFDKVGVNSYVRNGSEAVFSSRMNVITKIGREYEPNYANMAADLYNEVILQAITYYTMRK